MSVIASPSKVGIRTVLFTALMLTFVVCMGCQAAAEMGNSGARSIPSEAHRPQAHPQTDTPPELSNAHRDKFQLLTAISKLGKSAESDSDLLGRITKGVVTSTPHDKPVFRGVETSFGTSIVFLEKERIVDSASFEYGFDARNTYVPAIRLRLGKDVACIRVQDLLMVLGQPAKISRTAPSPHAKKTGPTDIWSVIYESSETRARTTFNFDTQECAWYVTLFKI